MHLAAAVLKKSTAAALMTLHPEPDAKGAIAASAPL